MTAVLQRAILQRVAAVLGALAVWSCLALSPAAADPTEDCTSPDLERRIVGCTELLMTPGLKPDVAAQAYSLRALAYQVKGLNEQALLDYNRSLALNPHSAVALNNRAWAYVKMGRPEEGREDVERSLAIEPYNADAYDTRGHIRQARGQLEDALADYEAAMRFGGERMVKLYQCGLQSQGLFDGEVDGIMTPALREALSKCVLGGKCDPLPPDEECRRATS